MLCTVTKMFKNSRGETFPPGSTIDIPDTMLLKMSGYVQPMGSADNHPPDWKPTFRAWLENDELRTTGVTEDLAGVIIGLTKDNLSLQKVLLKKYCGLFSNPCWQSLADRFIARAAKIFGQEGVDHRTAMYRAAEDMYLLSFSAELGITFHKPTDDTPPF